jgi:hypothetical protein
MDAGGRATHGAVAESARERRLKKPTMILSSISVLSSPIAKAIGYNFRPSQQHNTPST